MQQKPDSQKTLKEILSTDYHIPGISPRFYLPVCLLALVAVIAYTWAPGIKNADFAFVIAVLVVVGVSVISTTVQRILRRLRGK